MNFNKLLEQIKWLPSLDIKFVDIVQMVILAFALYYLTKSLYRTRAWILVKGMIMIGAVYLVICMTNMTVLQIIMQSLFSTLLIAIIIMLQPELQRIVELIGKRGLTDMKTLLRKKPEAATWYSEKSISEIVTACKRMSDTKTGALIVIERGIPLSEYINSGIDLGSSISSQLLINIFEKNTPLHDGAVIIKNDKIESATCYLPLSMNYSIDKSLGTRHRAGLGITESTDCIVVIVSEETGAMSVCVGGRLKRNLNGAELSQTLRDNMNKHEERKFTKKKSRTPMWAKILAPVLSIIIWLSVITVSDPLTTKVITDVPVSVINTEILDNAGHAYTIKSGNNITVKVQGKRSIVDNMTRDDLIAKADFSKMSIVNTVPITVNTTVEYADVEIVAENSHIIQLEIEDMVQTEIAVEVKVAGDTNNDYVICTKDVEADTIMVTCPQSLAKTLDKAILTVDAYGKETNFISTISPVVYDKNGNQIQDNKISINKRTIRVSMSVYEVKEIPITVTIAEQNDKTSAYYVLNDCSPEFDTIKIAADDETISRIQNIDIAIELDDGVEAAKSILVNLKQYIPEGVYLAKNQEEQMSVELDITKYQKIAIDLANSDIKLTGYDATTLSATITDAPESIVLWCNTDVVDPDVITLKMLEPTIRILEAEVGTYEGKIIITDIEGVSVAEELVAKYRLNIRRK